MTFFGLMIVLPIFILLIYVPGRLILAPLKRAALDPRPRVQFLTTEILLLTVQIGVVGMLMTGGSQRPERIFVFLAATLILGTWWLLGVRWLSHAGVTVPATRFWPLAIAVPMAFGTLPFVLMIMSFSVAVTSVPSDGTTTMNFLEWQIPMTNAMAATIQRTILISTLVMAIGHIPLCRWIVRRALRSREIAAA